MLRDCPEGYLEEARALFAPETNNPETYYRLHDEFNRTRSPRRRAALFLYLNRHGYNGLCRYNNVGEFNVPFGRYKRPYFPEEELRAAAGVLAKTKLTSLDFEEVLGRAGPGDVVYCNPPYVPLSATASFTDYAAGGFGREEQVRLAAAAADAAARARWWRFPITTPSGPGSCIATRNSTSRTCSAPFPPTAKPGATSASCWPFTGRQTLEAVVGRAAGLPPAAAEFEAKGRTLLGRPLRRGDADKPGVPLHPHVDGRPGQRPGDWGSYTASIADARASLQGSMEYFP